MKKIKKFISFLTAVLFIVNQFGVAPVSASPTHFSSEVKAPSSFQIDLPPDLGTIENLVSGSGPAIIHIQTAHGNYEAQKKIESILHYLKTTYGFKLLFLEGSASKLNSELIKFIPRNAHLNLEIADQLTKKGLIKGSELFLLETPEAQGYGIENLKDYISNGKAFEAVLTQQEKTKTFLSEMNLQIERLSSPYLNKHLKNFLKRLDDFETRKMVPLLDRLDYLKSQSNETLEVDLADPRHQIDWPMLLRLFKLKEFQTKINMNDYAKEKESFLRDIHSIPKETRQQIETLLSAPFSQNQLPDPETGLLFERMLSFLPVSFNFKPYPNVKLFIGHLILQSELKSDRLFEEMNLLADKISQKLAQTPEEKKLLDLFKDYRLLQKLFVLELTPSDYEVLLKRGEEIRPKNLAPHFLEINRAKRVQDSQFSHLEEIESLFDKATEFYQWAKKRDHSMIQNLETRLKEIGQGKAVAVVITGGFHSAPFKDYFRNKGYNYALIAPKITDVEGKDAYVQSALVKGFDFTETSTLEDAFLSDPLFKRNTDLNDLIKREIAAHFKLSGGQIEYDLKKALEQARSEMRATSKTKVPTEAQIKKYPAYEEVVNYYKSQEIVFSGLARGDNAMYKEGLQGMIRHARDALGKSKKSEDVSAIARYLRDKKVLSLEHALILEEDEILSVNTESFQNWEQGIIDKETDSFLEAIGYTKEVRQDLVRKIKLITYPLSLTKLMPESITDFQYDPRMLADLFRSLISFKTSRGMMRITPILNEDLAILVRPAIDASDFKATYFHEIIHYLALINYLPFDVTNEIITQAMSAVVYLENDGREAYLKSMGSVSPETKKLYQIFQTRGENDAKKGPQVLTPAEIESVVEAVVSKEAFFSSLEPAGRKDLIERFAGVYLAGYAFGLKQNDRQLNLMRFVVDYGKRYLPKVRSADYTRKLTSRDWNLINETLKTLRAVARVTLHRVDDRLTFEPRTLRDLNSLDRTRWFYEEPDLTMHYIPWDIIEYGEDGSVGLTLQEVFRANYSEEVLIEKPYDTVPFRLLYGVAETSRVVARGLVENPGRVKAVEDFYHKKLRIFDLEIEKERMAERPLFVQYIEALFYTLAMTKNLKRLAKDPRVTNPLVHAAIKKTFPEILKSLSDSGPNFYKTVRDKVWPEVENLLEKDKEEKIQDQLAEMQKTLDEMDEAERQDLEKRAGQKLAEEIGQEADQMSDITSDASGMQGASSGNKGKPQPGTGKGEPTDAQGLQEGLESLGGLAQEIQEQAGQIQAQAESAEGAAGSVEKKASKIDRAGAGVAREGQNVEQSIENLVEKLKALRAKAKEFHDTTEKVENEASEVGSGIPSRKSEKLVDKTQGLEEIAQSIQEEAAEADKIADEAGSSGKELTEKLADDQSSPESIKGRAKAIQEKMQKVKEKLEKLAENAEQAANEATEMQALAEALEEALSNPLPEVNDQEESDEVQGAGDPGLHMRGDTSKAKTTFAKRGIPKEPGEKEPKHHFDPKIGETLKKFLKETEDIDLLEQGQTESKQSEAIEKMTGLQEWQRKAIDRIRSVSRQYEATFRENILNALEDAQPAEILRRQRRGRLDPRRLAVVDTGAQDLFMRKTEPGEKKLRYSLLFDVSGSMYHDGNNFDLGEIRYRGGEITEQWLKAKSRINNAIKVAILYMEAFRDEDRIELEIGAFASNQKIVLHFDEPVTDAKVYEAVEAVLHHDLGGKNSDLAGLRMMVRSLRKRDNDEGIQPKILTIIADGGIDYSDQHGIQKILEESTDIVFLPVGIGPDSHDVKAAYAPLGRTVSNISDLVDKIGGWIQEQSMRLLQNPESGGRSEMRVVMAAAKAKQPETENFKIIREGGDQYLVVKGGGFPNFKAKINGEGANIPDIEILETKTNVKNIVRIIKRAVSQPFDRSPLYVIGEAGTGKNTLIYYAAKLLKKNVRFMAMHEDMTVDDLVERRGVNEKEHGKTDWIPSPIVEAMKNGEWVVLDEVGKLESKVRAALNQIVQSRRVRLHDGTWVEAKEGFAVIETNNVQAGSGDEKVYELKKDSAEILDRRRAVYIDYLPMDEEIYLLNWELMKARGISDPTKIPTEEKALIKDLVKLADGIRTLYKGIDPSTGRSIGRGKLVARPLSTRALVKIIKTIAEFPAERKRICQLIGKHYAYQWERDEQVRHVEEKIRNIFGQDDPYKLTAEDRKGPQYGNKGDERILKFAGIEIELGPDAPKRIEDVPLDMQVVWTDTNLEVLREMLMDFKRDNSMLLIGDAGTGKDTLAEYIGYLLYGPVVETYNVTYQTSYEDLIAYLGLGEGERVATGGSLITAGKGETGLVPAYIVRGMRGGHPNILSEINKAKPEALASLNNPLQFQWIDLANGIRQPANKGWLIIGTMNLDKAGEKMYLGNYKLSGEFLDRFSVLQLKRLNETEEIQMLVRFNEYLHRRDPAFKLLKPEFIKKLVEYEKALVEQYKKKKLPRPVSMRGTKRLIVSLAQYPEEYPDELPNLVTESFIFHDQVHQELVVETAQTAKLAEQDSIVDIVIETGDDGLDQALRRLRTSLGKSDEALPALIRFEKFLINGSFKNSALQKGRQVFVMLKPAAAKQGNLVDAAMAHVASRFDGTKDLPALPDIAKEIKTDLTHSGKLKLRWIGRMVSGVVSIPKQKKKAQFLEISSKRFLAISDDKVTEKVIEDLADKVVPYTPKRILALRNPEEQIEKLIDLVQSFGGITVKRTLAKEQEPYIENNEDDDDDENSFRIFIPRTMGFLSFLNFLISEEGPRLGNDEERIVRDLSQAVLKLKGKVSERAKEVAFQGILGEMLSAKAPSPLFNSEVESDLAQNPLDQVNLKNSEDLNRYVNKIPQQGYFASSMPGYAAIMEGKDGHSVLVLNDVLQERPRKIKKGSWDLLRAFVLVQIGAMQLHKNQRGKKSSWLEFSGEVRDEFLRELQDAGNHKELLAAAQVLDQETNSKLAEFLKESPFLIQGWERTLNHETSSSDQDLERMTISPNGRILLLRTNDGPKILNIETGRTLTRPETKIKDEEESNYDYGDTRTSFVDLAAFFPDSQRILVTATDEDIAGVWNLRTEKFLKRNWQLDRSHADHGAISPDGQKALIVYHNGTVVLTNLKTGEPIKGLKEKTGNNVKAASFSPDGKRIITTHANGSFKILDAKTFNVIRQFKAGSSQGWGFLSPNGRNFLTVSNAGKLQVWNVETGAVLQEKILSTVAINAAAFSQDGRQVLVSNEVQAQLWDIEDLKPLAVFRPEDSGVNYSSAVFSPDGKKVVLGTNDGYVEVWKRLPARSSRSEMRITKKTVDEFFVTLHEALGKFPKDLGSYQLDYEFKAIPQVEEELGPMELGIKQAVIQTYRDRDFMVGPEMGTTATYWIDPNSATFRFFNLLDLIRRKILVHSQIAEEQDMEAAKQLLEEKITGQKSPRAKEPRILDLDSLQAWSDLVAAVKIMDQTLERSELRYLLTPEVKTVAEKITDKLLRERFRLQYGQEIFEVMVKELLGPAAFASEEASIQPVLSTREINSVPVLAGLLTTPTQTKRQLIDYRQLSDNPGELNALVLYAAYHPDIAYNLFFVAPTEKAAAFRSELQRYVQAHHDMQLPRNFNIESVETVTALTPRWNQLFDHASKTQTPVAFITEDPALAEIGYRPNLLRAIGSSDPVLQNATALLAGERLLKDLSTEALIRVHRGEDLDRGHVWDSLVADLRKITLLSSAA